MKRFNKLALCLGAAILISGVYLSYPKQEKQKVSALDRLLDEYPPVIKNEKGKILHLPHGISALKPYGSFMKVREGYIWREDAQIYAEFKWGIPRITKHRPANEYYLVERIEYIRQINKLIPTEPPPESSSWTQAQWNNWSARQQEIHNFRVEYLGPPLPRLFSSRKPSLEDRLEEVELKLNELEQKNNFP